MPRLVFCRRPGCGSSQEVQCGIMPTACWQCYGRGIREPAKWSTIPWHDRAEDAIQPVPLLTEINYMDRRMLRAFGIAAF